MKTLFVDTSAWVAVVDRRDQYHVSPASFYRTAMKEYQQLVTTNLIVAETCILLRLDCGVDVALGWWEKITSSLKVRLVYADADITREAVELLRKFRDQTFSLTGAVSFAVMKQAGLKTAFTFDEYFSTAGFTRLPG